LPGKKKKEIRFRVRLRVKFSIKVRFMKTNQQLNSIHQPKNKPSKLLDMFACLD
jgi:hypothetical protein